MVTQKPRSAFAAKGRHSSKKTSLWEALREVADRIPLAAWEGLPTHAAKDSMTSSSPSGLMITS
jgi:hypothetical protein